MIFRKRHHIHFVGIGGIGMSGIAEVLLNLGQKVSGSDLKASETTRRLAALGADVRIGHSPDNVAEAEVVVVSSAVSPSNVEVQAANCEFIPVVPRAEMLAELMRLKYSIGVAGSHGKTTTTSLVATILGAAGLDPTMVIGGRLDSIGSNARLGDGDFLVAEADESDGSFLLLSPTIAVVTNIDIEHLDYYRDLDHIKETFLSYINKIPFYGVAVICLDDPNVQSLIPHIKKRYVSYGLTTQADIRAVDLQDSGLRSRYQLVIKGQDMGPVEITLPGRHNVLNSLAAVGVALELEIPLERTVAALNQAVAIQRRFQLKGEKSGIRIIDDYGHHPTEIHATLTALKNGYPDRRLVVLFQPHRYSRTKHLFESFFSAFNQADRLYLTEIYPAGEQPIEGVTGSSLADSVRAHGHHETIFEADVKRLPALVAKDLNPGDVVLTLGAGNIYQVGEQLLELLPNGSDDRRESE